MSSHTPPVALSLARERVLPTRDNGGLGRQLEFPLGGPYYGSRQLNYPWQLQGSFGFTRYLCGSPFIEVNTNVEQIYKNVQLNCFEVEPPVYFR